MSSLASSPLPVAIVGGGFSGAMLAARLAELGQASILIDRTGRFGLGVAYSTPFEGHLLNVRSGRMSAIEARPDDFVRWLEANRPELADPHDFAPRAVYGRYVQARLAAVEATFPGRIERRQDVVVSIETGGVTLAEGGFLPARAVVLATGNPPPGSAPGAARVIRDGWAPGALDGVGPEDTILIVGTGLTMVDMLQSLQGRGWRGRAVALSRRGLLPRAHAERPDAPATLPHDALTGPASTRLHAARALAGQAGWRETMEAFRPITASLWMEASPPVRARLVRHLRAWWDVHRHRIAGRVAEGLERLKSEGRLTVVSGRLGRVAADDEGVVVDWSPRGGGVAAPLKADWLIDCTGPGHSAATDSLTGPLIASGRARMDALGLGLDLDGDGRALGADGRPDPALHVLGPPARAAFWETIAVPDIRKRIEDTARVLSAP